MAADFRSRAGVCQEFSELRRILFDVRCEAMRAHDPKLFCVVTSELDRVQAEILAAGRAGKDPWSVAQDAKRRIAVVRKNIALTGSVTKQGHGNEAGTQKETVKIGR